MRDVELTPKNIKEFVGKPVAMRYPSVRGDRDEEVGMVTGHTPTGKTVHTSEGCIFKWRNAFKHYSLIGNAGTKLVPFIHRKPS